MYLKVNSCVVMLTKANKEKISFGIDYNGKITKDFDITHCECYKRIKLGFERVARHSHVYWNIPGVGGGKNQAVSAREVLTKEAMILRPCKRWDPGTWGGMSLQRHFVFCEISHIEGILGWALFGKNRERKKEFRIFIFLNLM